MIENFVPQPYELHAFTEDERSWLVLGWVADGGVLRAVGARDSRGGGGASGPPVVINPTHFWIPVSGCNCT